MSDLWMPGAERLDIGDHAPTDGGTAKAIAHITWDRNASRQAPQDLVPFPALRDYFTGGGRASAPHVLWDPFTGRVTQFIPANSRSKSLVDAPGGTRTNRAGSVVIQVEALFFPWCRVNGKTYESLRDTPCKGWEELHAWVASWGVASSWPMGKPTGFVSKRDERIWRIRSGWYGHAQVPENDHTDPGSWPDFPTDPGTSKYEPFPGAPWFTEGRQSPVVARMHDRLVAEGCDLYRSSSGKDTIGSGDVASYEAWQRKQGFTGSAATWPPGRTTWDALRVPKG
ncbi:peptidoglycan-binding protein [Streptomyces sp. NBC_01343]|uniref:peptidoglycan-binding protein n=1 Tax=Streptomyces sp. NBC_01343 TaxID=2903832 RepID=UPI002E160656|nr:peptidoglycan-binding protein [Streptomyces sp. NBC_01343]